MQNAGELQHVRDIIIIIMCLADDISWQSLPDLLGSEQQETNWLL